ncbi:MAG TPA: sugar transferase [Bacteroidaceae bacterium]|nr:sugar transferase [Bacteroidaceae bacterium]
MRNIIINKIGYEPVVSVDNKVHFDAMNGVQRFFKRMFDLVFSFIALILLSPLLLLFFVILLFDKGPVIYSQERIGYKRKPFLIYKFRSMRTDAEVSGIPRMEEERNRQITKIGRFMRCHHLDELPQLWNVLKGDMSFVGPRPERAFFIEQIESVTDEYQYIYLMRPGLTSRATLYNGYTDTMEKMLIRLKMDLDYLDNRSLWLDFTIILKTAWSIISGKKF